MDLIPSVNIFHALAAVPLVYAFGAVIVAALFQFLDHPLVKPIVNTTLVILKNTEVVWRPAIKFAVVLIKPILKALAVILPIIKAVVVYVANATVNAFRTAKDMGMSLANTFPALAQGVKDLGESLIILARGLGKLTFYIVRFGSLIVGSVESLFIFGKRLLFETHLLTMADLYNVLFPLAIVLGLVGIVYWFRKSPSPQEKPAEICLPRRSSRIARKRAMLCSADLSDALSPGKKSSSTSTNL